MFKNLLNLKWSFGIVALVAIIAVACQQEELSFNFNNNEEGSEHFLGDFLGDGHGRHHEPCFELVFPVKVVFPDSTSVEVADKDALEAAIKTWRENNPRVHGRSKIAFPYNVTLEDGTVKTIANEEDFKAALATCLPHGDRERCFQFVFPITLTYPDGTTATIADSAAFHEALKNWRTNNPDAEDRPSVAFPYQVTLQDGTVQTIASEEDLQGLLETCRPREGRERCFTVVFPVTINFPDGTTAEAADQETFHELVRTWRTNNPNVEGRPEIAFPYTIQLKDGTTATINSEEDLKVLVGDCIKDAVRCFELIFPVTVEYPDGTSVEVTSAEAYKAILMTWYEENPNTRTRPEVVFPYDVELRNGDVVTINSLADLKRIERYCDVTRDGDRDGRHGGGRGRNGRGN